MHTDQTLHLENLLAEEAIVKLAVERIIELRLDTDMHAFALRFEEAGAAKAKAAALEAALRAAGVALVEHTDEISGVEVVTVNRPSGPPLVFAANDDVAEWV